MPEPDRVSPRRQAFGGAVSNTFRALRNRNYRLFWYGNLVSMSGTWMQRVAQAWLVLQLTDSPLALGTVSALQLARITLLSLFGGVIADQVPKRKLLVATQLVMMSQALAIAALTTSGLIELWHVYLLAALLGTASAVDAPTRQAILVELVGSKDLPNAIALNSSLFNAARIAGPALAGFLIALVGIAACFWLNAASFVAVIAALLAMRPAEFSDVPNPKRGRTLGQLREGLVYALRSPDVCLIVILLAAFGTFGFNFQTFIPLLARYVVDSGPVGFGGLFSFLGAGSVLSALSIAGRTEATERSMLLGAAAFGVLFLLVALSPWYPVTAGLLGLLGVASIVFSATANTRLQLSTPPELRGRVMSLYSFLFMGTTPIGAFVIGTLSERLGVQIALAICAGLCLAGLAAALVYRQRQQPRRSLTPVPSDAVTAGPG